MQSCAPWSGLFKPDMGFNGLVEPSNYPSSLVYTLLGRTGLDLGFLDSIGFWLAVLGSGGLCCAVLGSVGLYEAVQY